MIPMVDLHSQYLRMEHEIDAAIKDVLLRTDFIKGKQVGLFEEKLADYLKVRHLISCANGTDALQIALMAIELQPGDEVIVPAFTYVATAEVIALLGLIPVMVDVEWGSFNVAVKGLEQAITDRTRAIVPVHLFGHAADMEPLMTIAQKHNLWVIEDNAQSLGTDYHFSNGSTAKTGTIGQIGCNSFFPTKNLGCYGDGGAIMTNDENLAARIRMIANHGQEKKYYHKVVGCNSRLDTLQAAVLNVKMKYLTDHLAARQNAGNYYKENLKEWEGGVLPATEAYSSHTFNQFTLKVLDGKRDVLKTLLKEQGIPSMIYYPLPLYRQEAFSKYTYKDFCLPVSEELCRSVLSIPIHSEMTEEVIGRIVDVIGNEE